jgi:uncharacterized protein (TIGR00730 family)
MSVAIRSLCVFCGAHTGARPEYADAARTVGRLLAEENIRLVYGAGKVGLMGILAESCLEAGGHVIGVIPDSLVRHEVAHLGVTDLRIVSSMHERKALMADLADAFVALPGGIGTFEEFFEIWTWSQLGLQQKPVGLLNVAGYYAPLIALADHAVTEGFLRPEHRAVLQISSDPHQILEKLRAFSPTDIPKWITPAER